MRLGRALAVVLTLCACKDLGLTGRESNCTAQMASVRQTLGTPFQTSMSGDSFERLEVWDFHEGANIRRYRFRSGRNYPQCIVENSLVTA